MTGILLAMQAGPYQDNGASPWFANVGVGSQSTEMKLAIDTGTNMTWVTSTKCHTASCLLPTRVRFDYATSTSFEWFKSHPEIDFDYGPWGTLKAEMGSDFMQQSPNLPSTWLNFGNATNYGGQKFDEVDWDGCLGFPSQGPTQHGMSFFYETLVNDGTLAPGDVFLAFDWDWVTKTGTVNIGDCDPNAADFGSGVFLPFNVYDAISGVGYIWTTANATVEINGQVITNQAFFGLDSGSSRFKGDQSYISAILAQVAQGQPDLTITAGYDWTRQPGQLVIPSDIYEREIEKGSNAGQTLPQFAPLTGTDQLLIVGSVLMDYLYTIYVYRNEWDDVASQYVSKPYGTWIFNKPGGPKIIQNSWAVDQDAALLIDAEFVAKG